MNIPALIRAFAWSRFWRSPKRTSKALIFGFYDSTGNEVQKDKFDLNRAREALKAAGIVDDRDVMENS